jgi:hypothetical protein
MLNKFPFKKNPQILTAVASMIPMTILEKNNININLHKKNAKISAQEKPAKYYQFSNLLQ